MSWLSDAWYESCCDRKIKSLGYVDLLTGDLTSDVMSRLSKDGKMVYPTEDELEIRILRAKYLIYQDMANTQIRYRKEIDSALSKIG
jgi:hypothetical protein